MIYVNSILPLQELSKIQKEYDDLKKQKKKEEYFLKNRDKLREYSKLWNKNNKERVKEYRKKRKLTVTFSYNHPYVS